MDGNKLGSTLPENAGQSCGTLEHFEPLHHLSVANLATICKTPCNQVPHMCTYMSSEEHIDGNEQIDGTFSQVSWHGCQQPCKIMRPLFWMLGAYSNTSFLQSTRKPQCVVIPLNLSRYDQRMSIPFCTCQRVDLTDFCDNVEAPFCIVLCCLHCCIDIQAHFKVTAISCYACALATLFLHIHGPDAPSFPN